MSELSTRRSPQKTVLTIAGFDPSSGAGVTADLMVFAAHGLFGTSCITALTVQSTLGVRAAHPVSGAIVAETLQCLDADLRPAGIKIGMLATQDNILHVSAYLKQLNLLVGENDGGVKLPVVLDPVLRSTSGRELLDEPGVVALRDLLLPLVDWVTPNVHELGVLLGEPVLGREDVPEACRALQAQVAGNAQIAGNNAGRHGLGIFATGGHLEPPDDYLLTPAGVGVWLPGERVDTRSTHGTGCALSSAFLCRLVLGEAPEEAARHAKAYVAGALMAAETVGSGAGPMNHLWALVSAED
jgi:hydroxymethylpyrimidine/phosphomethylpyrimidine kinase